jgi:hypothetical protein
MAFEGSNLGIYLKKGIKFLYFSAPLRDKHP